MGTLRLDATFLILPPTLDTSVEALPVSDIESSARAAVSGPIETVTIFGLGDAGGAIAAHLARLGVEVRAYDPADVATPPGVARFATPAQAMLETDAVLSITSADDSSGALLQAIGNADEGTLYADLSTASPQLKERLAVDASGAGFSFADVAMMGTVPGTDFFTPQLASGPGALQYAALAHSVHFEVPVLSDRPGEASGRKLLRSIFAKGFSALLVEAMGAAKAAGLDEWLWKHLVDTLDGANESMMHRYLRSTGAHAVRRKEELRFVIEMLGSLDVDDTMSQATHAQLERIATSGLPDVGWPLRDPGSTGAKPT